MAGALHFYEFTMDFIFFVFQKLPKTKNVD